MSGISRHRILIISRNIALRNELVTLLSGYGYFVDFCSSRLEGFRRFRSHKQPIVILDVPVLRTFSDRVFRLIRMVRLNTIVLIAAHRFEEKEAFGKLKLGAYDVLNLPLKTDFLRQTLSRAQTHHRLQMENFFVKNLAFFGLLLLPVWVLLGYLLIQRAIQ